MSPQPFRAPGRRLEKGDAPELFAALDDLAARARTAPPSEVYLSPFPDLFVTETGGTLGFGSRRILVVGVPIVEWLTVQELRAVLAHELGHYLGGDTRLCGVLGFVHASFRSMVVAVQKKGGSDVHITITAGREVAHAIGNRLVELYAQLFLKLTRPGDRRQELAADALSASVAGPEAAIRALEKISVSSLLFHAYLQSDVESALRAGAMPRDVMRGYRTFRDRCRERGAEKELLAKLRAERTDPLDTHPALTERIEAIRAVKTAAESPREEDARRARTLFSDTKAMKKWLVDDLLGHTSVSHTIRLMPWESIGRDAYTKAAETAATRCSLALHHLFPRARRIRGQFAAVVEALESGAHGPIVYALEPKLAYAHVAQQEQLGPVLLASALATLFQGALVEAGAVALPSIGEPCILYDFAGEHVPAAQLAAKAMSDASARAAIRAWAARLDAV